MLYLRTAVNFYDYLVARKDLCFGMLRMCGVGLRLRSTAASSKVCGVEGGNGCMLEWRGPSVCTYLASLVAWVVDRPNCAQITILGFHSPWHKSLEHRLWTVIR